MDDECESYKLWRIRKTVMQVTNYVNSPSYYDHDYYTSLIKFISFNNTFDYSHFPS